MPENPSKSSKIEFSIFWDRQRKAFGHVKIVDFYGCGTGFRKHWKSKPTKIFDFCGVKIKDFDRFPKVRKYFVFSKIRRILGQQIEAIKNFVFHAPKPKETMFPGSQNRRFWRPTVLRDLHASIFDGFQ